MADEIVAFIKENSLKNQWILETHIHADHLSAASYLKDKVGGKVAASQFINNACDNFIPIFNLDENDSKPKIHFDYLFSPDEEFFIGEFNAKALYVPGHTPADTAYYVEDIIFVGDTLFAPDVGTARCAFPEEAQESFLIQSIESCLFQKKLQCFYVMIILMIEEIFRISLRFRSRLKKIFMSKMEPEKRISYY